MPEYIPSRMIALKRIAFESRYLRYHYPFQVTNSFYCWFKKMHVEGFDQLIGGADAGVRSTRNSL